MDERVFVSIKGLHFASGVQDSDSDGSEDEEVIETVNTGRYKRSGENEYIKSVSYTHLTLPTKLEV